MDDNARSRKIGDPVVPAPAAPVVQNPAVQARIRRPQVRARLLHRKK